MEKVIKNMNIKPLLERAEFEKLSTPEKGATINLRVGDTIEFKEINEDTIKVFVSRTVASNPESLFKIYVEMSAEIKVDKEEFDKLINKNEYFKSSPITRAIIAQIATLIANMTSNSQIGPMLTMPMFQK